MVDTVACAAGAGEDELGDRNKGVAVLQQGLNNTRQGFRRVFGCIVKENDE